MRHSDFDLWTSRHCSYVAFQDFVRRCLGGTGRRAAALGRENPALVGDDVDGGPPDFLNEDTLPAALLLCANCYLYGGLACGDSTVRRHMDAYLRWATRALHRRGAP